MIRAFAGAAVFLSFVFSPSAWATWSIVIVDSATGEVAVASATCVNNADLKKWVPVIRVGVGGAAAQALVPFNAKNKIILFDELAKGTSPDQILAIIQQSDGGFQDRQFGIVNMEGQAATFTGSNAFAYAAGVTGTVGSMTYSIQGNILTGKPVLTQARQALINTPGDLAEKIMAAMVAARNMGGDGRCSCSPQAPTSCGAPPPSFTKSAHVGFMIISRIGDMDGVCGQTTGCASGSYYMDLNIQGNQSGQPDPVDQLQGLFAAWRASWANRPDHVLSETYLSKPVLPGDGVSVSTLTLRLVDWRGNPLTQGGAHVAVSLLPGGDDVVSVGTVVDLGNGVYTIPLTARANLGKDLLEIVVDDGQGPIVLYPMPEIATARKAFLTSPVSQISASLGDDVPLAIAAGSGLGDRAHLILCSLSGTSPGFYAGSVYVPLALDSAILWSYLLCGTSVLPNSCGYLDASGAANASLVVGPNDLLPAVSHNLSFAAITMDPPDFSSDPVIVSVNP